MFEQIFNIQFFYCQNYVIHKIISWNIQIKIAINYKNRGERLLLSLILRAATPQHEK
jgi:hypothetical protein